ncbi:unnamed protein product [Mytilus coruscus]|uniref:Uncharacterized protein n=1 Tax=Mytilus coruscus TaxID=42192 RepID=A0A6J8CDU1_MYTCO|nr:unnamed protein product [Mytilus coruscus]
MLSPKALRTRWIKYGGISIITKLSMAGLPGSPDTRGKGLNNYMVCSTTKSEVTGPSIPKEVRELQTQFRTLKREVQGTLENLLSEIQRLTFAVRNNALPASGSPSPRSTGEAVFTAPPTSGVNAVHQGCSEDITPLHTDTLLEEISQHRDTGQGQRILQEKVSVGESFILNPFQTAGHMPEGIDMISKIPLGELHIEKQIPGTEEGDPINNTSPVMSCSKRETPLNQLELSETIQSCVGESRKLVDRSLSPPQSPMVIIEQSETPVHGQEGDTAMFKAGVVQNQGPNPFSERGIAPDLLVSTMSGLEWEAPFRTFEVLKEDGFSKMKFGKGALGLMPAGTADMLREVENWAERVEQAEAEAQMNGEQSQQWDPGIAFLEHNQQLLTVLQLLENNGVCGILGNPQREGKGVIQKEGIEGILQTQAVLFEYDFQL